MTEPTDPTDGDPFPIDLSIARLARVENFLEGGDAHFEVDRAAAESIGELTPGGMEGLRAMIRAVKGFVARAVRYVTGELGARQFLHVGMSTPTTGMLHELAWEVAPATKVVYVSYDPTTLAHIHSLGKGATEGTVAHVHCSFDDTETILREAGVTLDFDQPIALVLPTTLTLVPDDDDAQRIIDDLRTAVSPGSYLIFAHSSLDMISDPERLTKAIDRFNEVLSELYVVRSRAQITKLLAGFDLIEPGLVSVEHWHPDEGRPPVERRRLVSVYGAVGRKP